MNLLPVPTKVGTAAAVVIVLWASAFVAVKAALTEWQPEQLALARYIVASAAFLALAAQRRKKIPPFKDLCQLALAGAVGIAIYNLAVNRGQATTSAGVASMVINTSQVWILVLSTVFLKERIALFGWVGAFISFSGVALISLSRGNGFQFDGGVGLILVAAFSQALYFIIIKPLLTRHHALEVTAYVVWFGTFFLLPFHDGLMENVRQSSDSIRLAVIFLGLGPAALAYVAWSYVLKNMPASRATRLLFFVPVVAILLGWAVLAEQPSPLALLGGAIAIGGVALSQKGYRASSSRRTQNSQ